MRPILLFLLLFVFFNSIAQFRYSLDSEIQLGKGDNAPFWFTSNRNGLTSQEPNNGLLRIGISRKSTVNKDFDYSTGGELVEKISQQKEFFIHQAYVDLRFKKLAFFAGSKEQSSFLKNDYLSSGGLTISTNARPIPQIKVGTAEYISFPWLLNGDFKVKSSCAYSRFVDNAFQRKRAEQFTSYNQDILYHRKDLALRYNRKNSPWQYNMAIETNTQFGSNHYTYDDSHQLVITQGNASLKDYFMVLLPHSGDNTSVLEDQEYMYGNSLGSEYIRISYTKPNNAISIYAENYFEDFSGMGKENGLDGLWGIEYKHNTTDVTTNVVLEYIQTTHQSGPIHWAPDDEPTTPLKNQATGSDNYYNNHSFAEGWSHFGQNIGNPLLTSPIYNSDGKLFHYNNRIKALHLGISAQMKNGLGCRILSTWSRNFGTMDLPFIAIQNQFSMLSEISFTPKKVKGYTFTFSSGYDKGETIVGNNMGFAFKIQKIGIIN